MENTLAKERAAYQQTRVQELIGIICLYCAMTENNRVDELLDQIAQFSADRYYTFDAILATLRNDTPDFDDVTPHPVGSKQFAQNRVKALTRFCYALSSSEFNVAHNDQNKVPPSMVIPKLIESLSAELQGLADLERGDRQVS